MGQDEAKIQSHSFLKHPFPLMKLNKFIPQNPDRLVNFVCGSNYKIDGEDVQIKPDSEYPVSKV